MKRYYAAALLTLTLFMSGCFRQDYSDCVIADNLILKLELKDGSGASLFAQNINSIYAVVYDDANRYVAHAEVAKNELNRFPGVSFTVEPGRYRVVCWGNIGQHTAVKGIGARLGFEECHLETVSDITGSPLYYAPKKAPAERVNPITRSGGDIDYGIYTVDVPPNAVTAHEVEFGRAHRSVSVYLKGYHTEHEAAVPAIKMKEQPYKTDFFLRTDGSRKSYESRPEEVDTQDGKMRASTFSMPITPFSNDMILEVVRDSDGEVVASVDLKQYVEDNASRIEDTDEFGILIRFTLDGQVEVTVPGWSNGPLTPGWGNN